MTERTVFNHEQFANAIADADVDIIRLGADIELESHIIIPNSKSSLTIDGFFNGTIHQFTDKDSHYPTDTLEIPSGSNIHLTIQNMRLRGRNFYGIPMVSEIATTDVILTYRDISYVGPQLVFHTTGLTEFENVDITVSQMGASEMQEVGEVCNVTFSGTNNIIRQTNPDDSVFWFRGPANTTSFTMLPNSKLTVNSASYFIYTTLGGVPVTLEENSNLDLHVNYGFTKSSLNLISSFTVDRNASFHYVQDSPHESEASMYLAGAFTVNEGGSVYMQADFEDASALIYYPLGSGNFLNLVQPKSFVLYNRSHTPLYNYNSLISRSFNIITEEMNHWISAESFPNAGTFLDIPTNKWNNADRTNFVVTGTLTNNRTTATATDLADPDVPIENFSFQNMRVFSVGKPYIEADPVIDNGRPITGHTDPHAELIIDFTVEETEYILEDITADETGKFTADTPISLPAGTEVHIRVNTPFLISVETITAIEAGSIDIVRIPVSIVCKTPPILTDPLLLGRDEDIETHPHIRIEDSRVYRTPWTLSASISGPLRTDGGDIMEQAIVYRDSSAIHTLSKHPFIIRTSTGEEDEVTIDWEDDEGILVWVETSIRSGVKYKSDIIWTLDTFDED